MNCPRCTYGSPDCALMAPVTCGALDTSATPGRHYRQDSMARPTHADPLDSLPDGGPKADESASLTFSAYLAGNNTNRQALGAGGQDGEAWLCLEVSRDDAAMLLQHFHVLTGRAFQVTIDAGADA